MDDRLLHIYTWWQFHKMTSSMTSQIACSSTLCWSHHTASMTFLWIGMDDKLYSSMLFKEAKTGYAITQEYLSRRDRGRQVTGAGALAPPPGSCPVTALRCSWPQGSPTFLYTLTTVPAACGPGCWVPAAEWMDLEGQFLRSNQRGSSYWEEKRLSSPLLGVSA